MIDSKLIKTIFIAAAITAAACSACFAQSTNTIVTVIINQPGVDFRPVDGRFYILNKDNIQTPEAIGYGGSPARTLVFSGALENSIPTLNNGDMAVNLVEKENNGGTIAHRGFYSVTNEAIISGESYEAPVPDLRAIPRPFVTSAGGIINISWNPAVDDGHNNIIGYNLYRSTNGIAFTKVNSSKITGTATTDAGVTEGFTYYYALTILFRGTLTTPEVETLYKSANSNPVTVGTPGVSIISVDPYWAYPNTSNLLVTIEGSGTHFSAGSTVAFQGLDSINVTWTQYVSPEVIRVRIDVGALAQIGPRNVVVTTPIGVTAEVAVGENMFWVIPQNPTATFTLDPNKGLRNANYATVATGTNTDFDQALTIAYFGPEITVNPPLTVTSTTQATINISIHPDATLGTKLAFMWNGIELAVGSMEVVEMEIEDGLIPNFPNPFDPRREVTRFVINLDEPTEVGIYIYDITARQVWKEVLMLPAGQNQVVWRGYTYFNKVCDNGVYLVRVVNERDKKFIGKGKPLVIKR